MTTTALAEQFPFVASLSPAARRALTQLPVRRIPARQAVLRRGDEVEGLYLLTRGALRVFHTTAEGREATLYWIKPGQTCILALTAALQRARYPAWVESDAQPVSLVVVPERMVRGLLGEPAFRDFAFAALAGRVFELMTTLEQVSSLRIEQRVAGFVLDHAGPTGIARLSQERLAAHLGTAREVVSRAVRALVAEGAITTTRGQIRIADRALLAQLAGPDDL